MVYGSAVGEERPQQRCPRQLEELELGPIVPIVPSLSSLSLSAWKLVPNHATHRFLIPYGSRISHRCGCGSDVQSPRHALLLLVQTSSTPLARPILHQGCSTWRLSSGDEKYVPSKASAVLPVGSQPSASQRLRPCRSASIASAAIP